jgi:methyl-accepting chemotaxis protein
MAQNKRKQKLVNTSMQHGFILRVYFSIFVSLLVFTGVMYLVFRSGVRGFVSGENFLSKINVLKDVNAFMVELFSGRLFIIALAVLLISFLVTYIMFIYYSHRIAGPAINFKNTFNKIKSGDKSARVSLRKNDYLKELADEFNNMMDSM